VPPSAQPVKQAVNAPPVVAVAPAADQGAKVLDMLETIRHSGAHMSRGLAPSTRKP
jgi:hypothetical protein